MLAESHCWFVVLLINMLISSKESRNATIELSDDDPKSVERMLSHMYTDDYDEDDKFTFGPKSESKTTADTRFNLSGSEGRELALNDDAHAEPELTGPPSPLTTYSDLASDDAKEFWKVKTSAVWNNIQVYALAEKYDVQPLKSLAAKRFKIGITGQWETDDILMVLAEVYNTTPNTDRQLRDDILPVCARYSDELIVLPEFHEMLRNDGALAVDVARMLHKDKQVVDIEVNELKEALRDLSAQNLEIKRKAQSLQDKLTHKNLWAAEEERVLNQIIARYARCPSCEKPLDLHMTKGDPLDSKKQIAIHFHCAQCGCVIPNSSEPTTTA